MPALRALPALAPAPPAAIALHRRRPQVIVRAPGSLPPVRDERRRHHPTLPGLGFREELDTLPIIDDDFVDEPSPVSHVRTKVKPKPRHAIPPPPPPSSRRKPVTLLDDVHEAMSREYLREAERLVASGLFSEIPSRV